MKKVKFNLVKKIYLGSLLVSLLPFGFFSFSTYQRSIDMLEKEVTQNLVTIADNKVRQVHDYFHSFEEDLSMIVDNPATIKAIKTLGSASGADQAGSLNREEIIDELRSLLKSHQAHMNFSELFFVDNDGDVIYATEKSDMLGANVSTGPQAKSSLGGIFLKVRTLLETAMSDFERHGPSKKYSAFIGTPIFERGNFIGLIVIRINVDVLHEIISGSKGLGETGETVVASLSGKEIIFMAPLRNDPEGTSLGRIRLGSEEGLAIQEAVQGKRGSGVQSDYRDKKVLAAWRYLPELGWGMVVKVDLREAFSPIFDIQRRSVLIGILTIVMVLVLAYIFSNSISGPIRALSQGTEIISRGNLDYQVSIRTNDEIGQLAVSFNEMTTKLRESYENLEDKIKQRTSELRESEEKTRLIIETANDAFVSMDQEGQIIDWNHSAEKIFGWPRSVVIGKLMTETIIPVQYREAHTKGLKHFVATGEGPVIGRTSELAALHQDGHEFPIEITIWSIRVDVKYQFNAFIRDISERKKTETKLKKAYEELEERERSLRKTFSDLQTTHEELKTVQTQLLQSEKLASIGQLAAGIAHEINNPIGFISSNLQSLEQYLANYAQLLRIVENLKMSIADKDMERAARVAEEMAGFEEEIDFNFMVKDIDNLFRESQSGMERIKKIIQDLRTFARADKDVMEMVKVEAIIDSVLSIIHNEMKYKAELKKDYGDVPLVKGNPQRLGQVFINLLLNAVQSIKEKGVIEIKTYTKGDHVCVDVSDTGLGIEEQNLNKVFDAFYTTKPVGQGTGLGLSISYEIVKKHGGEMKVESKVGEGTTFTVMLPINNEGRS